ncbi:hypothetical protein jhhlp_005417, partial [Lomentospora prolificans]
DPSWDVSNLSREEFDGLVRRTGQEFQSILDTTDADLTNFRNSGGKMMTFRRLADNVISPKISEKYYDSVAEVLPDVHHFY